MNVWRLRVARILAAASHRLLLAAVRDKPDIFLASAEQNARVAVSTIDRARRDAA